MVDINHNTLTGADLHEPKGAATAPAGSVYVADAGTSGVWTPIHTYIGAYVAFDGVTPAYTHATGLTDTTINPTLVVATSNGFSVGSPAKLIYDGTFPIKANLSLVLSVKNASGTSRDVELAFFKNGVELAGTRVLRTIVSGAWGSIAMSGFTPMVTTDYIDVRTRTVTTAGTIHYASAYFTIMGVTT